MADAYGFSGRDVGRISQTVRAYERDPLDPNPPGRRTGGEWSPRKLLGKTVAAIAKGASGEVQLYRRPSDTAAKGAEVAYAAEGSEKITAYNRFLGCEANRWVYVEWIDGGFELTALELDCEE